jgi:hypothetical protein
LQRPAPNALPNDWCFELVFDYGEHDLVAPVPQETGQKWDCRADPFSNYRSTFEVRTYRRCRRALMFHNFPETRRWVSIAWSVRPTLRIRKPRPHPIQGAALFLLTSITQTGYRSTGPSSYFSKSLPPLELAYSVPVLDETVRELDSVSLENLPAGIDDKDYQWVDLDGEGASGILAEQSGGWFYKPNLSPNNLQMVDGEQRTLAQLGAAEEIARQPSLATLQTEQQQLLDLDGDGHLDLVFFKGLTPAFYERTEDQDWEPFSAFRSLPMVDWTNRNLRFIDLTGDGLADVLLTDDDAF